MPGYFEQFTDAHAHLPTLPEADAAIRIPENAKILLNAVRRSDFERVSALSVKHPEHIVPAFGIHPWYAEEWTDEAEKALRDSLVCFPQASIGEIGLDRCRGNAEAQETAFRAQLEIAAEFSRPASIHCVRAFGKTEAILREFFKTGKLPPFLLHAYSGSPEQAKIFTQLGGVFSAPRYALPKNCRTVPESDQTLDLS